MKWNEIKKELWESDINNLQAKLRELKIIKIK